MKRRDLERRLRIAGCFLKREGGNHSIWMNPKNGVTEAIPRHDEVKELLARKILKRLDAE
ncbi:MAG: type II toxin-antitoxin system HicA family toxin [Verrucomicrobiota bacterium]|nr:type II toxin-antitoxin system HicA family toxin [Verrucomicrobiota bacterium]